MTCDKTECIYGEKILDPIKGCHCKCYDNFHGYGCSLFNTTVLANLFDPLECNNVVCSKLENQITGKCPIKCLCMIKFILFYLNYTYNINDLFSL